jgi:hypothetical protein
MLHTFIAVYLTRTIRYIVFIRLFCDPVSTAEVKVSNECVGCSWTMNVKTNKKRSSMSYFYFEFIYKD